MIKHRIRLNISLFISALILISTSFWVYANTDKGRQIALEQELRGQGYADMTSTMEMILFNKDGDESHRQLRIKTIEGQGEEDSDKSLTIFDTPKDQKGTALLTYSNKGKSDDQWLYLPALKRVKKLASKNKSGPFMGSEFAFEDMSSPDPDKYDYTFLKEESVDGLDCFVVQSVPRDKYSGYTKIVSWIDKQEYRTIKVDFYDRKQSLLKTLNAKGFHQYLDKYWRPEELSMLNHQTGKSTKLLTSAVEFGVGLNENEFNKNGLKRLK